MPRKLAKKISKDTTQFINDYVDRKAAKEIIYDIEPQTFSKAAKSKTLKLKKKLKRDDGSQIGTDSIDNAQEIELDEPLFVIDTAGNDRTKKRQMREQLKAKRKLMKEVEAQLHEEKQKKLRIVDRMKARMKGLSPFEPSPEEKAAARLADIATLPEPRSMRVKAARSTYDLWDNQDEQGPKISTTPSKTYLMPNPVRQGRKTAELPSYIPHAGLSYNPDPIAQRDLVEKVTALDEEERKKANEMSRKLHGYKSNNVTENESSESEEEEEDENETDEMKLDSLSANPRTLDRRLTVSERNRREREKEREKQRQFLSDERKLDTQINRLPLVVAAIAKEEKKRKREKEQIDELKANSAPKIPRLGPHLYKPSFPTVLLEEESNAVGGVLLNVGADTQTIADTYQRLEERLLIEPRQKVGIHRRYKPKEFTRIRDHKLMGTLDEHLVG